MQTDSIERYRRSDGFSAWEQTSKSALHVTIASNHDFISYGRHHCWFSPVVLDMDGRLRCLESVPYATFVFRPPNSDTTIFEAMPVILIQLLRFLRERLVEEIDKRERLLAAARRYQETPTPGADEDSDKQIWHDKLKALAAVAVQVVQLFSSSETVYIVLDRADQCCARDQHGLFVVLHDIFAAASCVVKVFVVAGNVGWTLCERDIRCPSAATWYWAVDQKCLVPTGY